LLHALRALSFSITPITSALFSQEQELADLVKLHRSVVPHPIEKKRKKGVTQDITDWKTIGKLLKKAPVECVRKWNKIESTVSKIGPFTDAEDTVSKIGPFTDAEDTLIKQRVSAIKGQEVWVALQKELGRSAGVILQRWFSCLDGKE